jgi:RNA polymerase sigma-54 factor
MQTPQGLFELKFFFTSKLSTENGVDVASAAVKNRIKELIEQENPEKPLSDLKLSKILAEEKINIARRTVTKYREMMRIGSTAERKKRF